MIKRRGGLELSGNHQDRRSVPLVKNFRIGTSFFRTMEGDCSMIVSVAELKQQLNATGIVDVADDALIERKIKAAQDHIERLLGFKIETTYGGEDQPEIPASLVEAVAQTAAHWYENREAVLVGVSGQELPFGVWQIVNEYREYRFG